jgi:hypothetical protein
VHVPGAVDEVKIKCSLLLKSIQVKIKWSMLLLLQQPLTAMLQTLRAHTLAG